MNDQILSSLDKISQQFMVQIDSKGQILLKKYTQTFIYALVQKHIFDLEALFTENPKQSIDIFDFVYHMLKFTNQPNDETMYVVIQLIDFFKLICDESQDVSRIKFHDISNYICKYNPKIENYGNFSSEGRVIPTHHQPIQKQFRSDEDRKSRKVRDIDINPPIVIGGLGQDIQRINKDKMYIDSSKNQNSVIIRVVYSPALYYVFALHQYSDHVCLYYPDCTIAKLLRPSSPQLRNTIILDICWSEQQQRLGATLKDQWFCFWDANDLSYEKVFSSSSSALTNGDQLQIYYLNYVNKWITIDSDSKVHFWNLEVEQAQYTIQSNEFIIGGIIDVVEIDHLQLTCLAGLNFLTLWDMSAPKMLFKVTVNHNHLHQVVFFKTYQMIITCGYDNHINLYQLHKKYNDGDLMGKLEGHTSLVTAIQAIENTPMVITSDDKHIIKVWDIRILKCIQTFDLELRQPIGKIIILSGVQAVCFVTSRLLIIEMEKCRHNMPYYKHLKLSQKSIKQNDSQTVQIDTQAFPLRVELDSIKRRLLVCTKRDVRCFDMMTGKCLIIVKGIIDSIDDEITSFRTLQQHKKLIVGTQKGQIKIYDTDTGEKISEFNAHGNEISGLVIDYQNQIVTTTSFDSQINVWREISGAAQGSNFKQREFQYEKIREVKNAHQNLPILFTEVSIYHNLIITCSNSPQILIWNFEYGKLVASLTLEDNSEPTAVSFINGYSMLVIADNKGSLFFIHFVVLEEAVDIILKERIDPDDRVVSQNANIKFLSRNDSIRKIQINPDRIQQYSGQIKTEVNETQKFFKRSSISLVQSQEQNEQSFYQKLIIDISKNQEVLDGQEQDRISSVLLIASTITGFLHCFDITALFEDAQFLSHCNIRVNYNPYRQNKEDFLSVVNTHKINHWSIFGNKVTLDKMYQEEDLTRKNAKKSQKCIFVQQNKLLNQAPKITVKAHKESLTHLSFVSFEGENLLMEVQKSLRILSCSHDQYMKIWTHDLKLLCSLNINHPLPIRWEVTVDEQEVIKFKLAFALKVAHFIRKNCQSQMTVGQARMLEPGNMFKSILSCVKEKLEKEQRLSYLQKGEKRQSFLTQPKKKKSFQQIEIYPSQTERQEIQAPQKADDSYDDNKKVQLLREEFTPRDIFFEKIKHIYKQELEGPSLKQLEEIKKVHIFSQMWKQQQNEQAKNLEQLSKKNQHQNDEKQKELRQVLQFLHPKYKKRVLDNMEEFEKTNAVTAQLEQQLDKKIQVRKPSKSSSQNIAAITQLKLQIPDEIRKQEMSQTNDPVEQNTHRTNQQIVSSGQLKGFAELTEIDQQSQNSLPRIFLPKSFSKNNARGTTTTNFFNYAQERQLNESKSSTKYSLKTTRNWDQDEYLINKKVKILNDNRGQLISDIQGVYKKEVASTIGVNLMRKTSGNLFNQIVNKLDQKLKQSKYSHQNQGQNGSTSCQSSQELSSINKGLSLQDKQCSSQGRVKMLSKPISDQDNRQQQFDEKLDGIIMTVRDKISLNIQFKK